MNTVDIVGIGLSPEDLTEKHIKIINKAEVLVGGKRHLDYFKDHPGEKIVLTGDIKRAISEMKSRLDKKIVVLASGDPNFFGVGPRRETKLRGIVPGMRDQYFRLAVGTAGGGDTVDERGLSFGLVAKLFLQEIHELSS